MKNPILQIKIGAKYYRMRDIVNEIVRSVNTGDEDSLQFFGEFCRKEAKLCDAPPSLPLTHLVFNLLSCIMDNRNYAFKEAYIKDSVLKILDQIGCEIPPKRV